ncbi:hypothetical protein [Paraburkholderia sp. ZP32-5]|uniref:hypothetical protein n=1 Tax=Paraburkholderia sp. ZP32-5 TaxID=2883245 RepID=UPI001F1680C4|nr:hypothetical protein [Paraburkholderia sp. ZP32-5]
MILDLENQPDMASRLKEMSEENELLINQLLQVQDELERYHIESQRPIESGQPAISSDNVSLNKGWVDDELCGVLAENQRLRALVAVQRRNRQIEMESALNVKLGNVLIDGTDSPKALLLIPSKLGRIWRSYSRQTPPPALGGKKFDKVIASYGEGGFDAIEKLMEPTSISPTMRANAYTALARHMMKSDRTNASEAARRAYAVDPKPYRLKWLAFRLHEAGEVIEAEAMLEILPVGTQFSESEARQASQVRYESKQARQREAKQEAQLSGWRAGIEKQLNHLAQQRDEQSRLASEYGTEIAVLSQTRAQLEGRNLALTEQLHEAEKRLSECVREIEALKEGRTQTEKEKIAIVQQYEELTMLVVDRNRDVEALTQAKVELEREKLSQLGQYDDTIKLLADRTHEIETLKQNSMQLEQDMRALAEQHGEAMRRISHYTDEVETLTQARALFEQQNLALEEQRDDVAKRLAECTRDVDSLKQAEAQLKQEKQALNERHDEVVAQMSDSVREIDALRQAKNTAEQERLTLAEKFGASTKLSAVYLEQISALKQQIETAQIRDTELGTRQKVMQEEMMRAEAQLDLIKDLLLREFER